MVTHFVATNRKGFDICKSNESQLEVEHAFIFGSLDFDPDGDCARDVFSPFPSGDSDYSTCLTAPITSLKGYARFFRELYELVLGSDKEILFFMHGYRHSVRRMQETIRKLHRIYVRDERSNIGHIVMFSWPSTANTGEYEEDLGRAKETGKCAFSRLLCEMRDFVRQAFPSSAASSEFVSKINLAVASMGNMVIQTAAGELDNFDTQLFHEVIHTCPDVNVTQFEDGKGLKLFSQLAGRVHVHFNYEDVVLDLSTYIVNDFERRLGKDGPTLATPEDPKITYVNVSIAVAVAAMHPSIILNPGDEQENPIVHCYFLKVKAVADDAKRVFAHQQRIFGRSTKIMDDERNVDQSRKLVFSRLMPDY